MTVSTPKKNKRTMKRNRKAMTTRIDPGEHTYMYVYTYINIYIYTYIHTYLCSSIRQFKKYIEKKDRFNGFFVFSSHVCTHNETIETSNSVRKKTCI